LRRKSSISFYFSFSSPRRRPELLDIALPRTELRSIDRAAVAGHLPQVEALAAGLATFPLPRVDSMSGAGTDAAALALVALRALPPGVAVLPRKANLCLCWRFPFSPMVNFYINYI